MGLDAGKLEGKDVEWFATDLQGCIGFFTTGGCGPVPTSLAKNLEKLVAISQYFRSLQSRHCDAEASSDWQSMVSGVNFDDKNSCANYLSDFLAMSSQGLFSFDALFDEKYPVPYFLVAIPTKALHVEEVPNPIGRYLRMFTLAINFEQASVIDVSDLGDYIV